MPTVLTMCQNIYNQAIDASCKFEPELLIGLSRGGLVPVGFLAGDGMFANRNVKIISITSYSNTNQQSEIRFVMPVFIEELTYLSNFKSILIVDDLVDSGKSLAWILDLLQKHLPNTEIRTAALFYKKSSIIKPDFYAQETTSWIVFPWEA